MGLVLDSSVLIAAERAKRSVSDLLASLSAEHSETEFLLSSVSVMELEHGWHRANTPEADAKRRRFLDEVLAILLVEPFRSEMGVLAAKIDADMKKVGLVIPTADLLIGNGAALRLRAGNRQRPPLQNDPRLEGPSSLAAVGVRHFSSVDSKLGNIANRQQRSNHGQIRQPSRMVLPILIDIVTEGQ